MARHIAFLISLFGAVTWIMAENTAPAALPLPQKLVVAIYLANSDLAPGQNTDVIVRISNVGEVPASCFTYAGLRVFHTRPDGSRVPLERRERHTPPATAPGVLTTGPAGWLDAFSVAVEVDCPYDPNHLEPFSVDLAANGKIAPEDLPPNRSRLIERFLPEWVFASGDCQIRAILYKGHERVSSSEIRTIHVKGNAK